MRPRALRAAMPAAVASFALLAPSVGAADWPEWRGPHRDGVSRETGLLEQWPEAGPPLVWSATGLGAGHSSVSVAEGKVYVTGKVDKTEQLSVFGLDATPAWRTTYGRAWTKSYPDARTTPTIRDGAAYVISGMGEIVCLDVASGTVRWSVDGLAVFEAKQGTWGTSESPLVVDDKVVYTPAGSKTTIVALDRHSGKTVWTSPALGDRSAYVSPLEIEVGGRSQIVAVTAGHVLGVDTRTGTIDWRVRYQDIAARGSGADINANTPLFHDGRVYVTSGYNHAGIMLALGPDGRSASVEWVDPTLDTHHGHVVLVDGHIYGANWLNNRKGNWVGLSWQTGAPVYEAEWFTKGSIVAAEGMLYCYEERGGNLALVKASPRGFEVVSSFRITEGKGPHWAHPTISDGRLYVRHGDALMVYDIRKSAR